MADQIIGIHMEGQVPAGILGPAAAALDIRAYLVRHGSGLVLVDTGMDRGGTAIDAALEGAGATWSDVSHVVITHGHPDHTGALSRARASAPGTVVLAHPLEMIGGAEALADGQTVGSLRVLATPGHTPGHLSPYGEANGMLLVGDCLGVADGKLARAPARFTANAAQAEQSLHRLLGLRGARMLFGHGPEIAAPWDALEELLAQG